MVSARPGEIHSEYMDRTRSFNRPLSRLKEFTIVSLSYRRHETSTFLSVRLHAVKERYQGPSIAILNPPVQTRLNREPKGFTRVSRFHWPHLPSSYSLRPSESPFCLSNCNYKGLLSVPRVKNSKPLT